MTIYSESLEDMTVQDFDDWQHADDLGYADRQRVKGHRRARRERREAARIAKEQRDVQSV